MGLRRSGCADLGRPAVFAPGVSNTFRDFDRFAILRRRRKSKHYTAHFAEDEEGDVTGQLRKDRKWSAGLAWRHTLTTHVVGMFGVEVERWTSNDPDKPYTASALVMDLCTAFREQCETWKVFGDASCLHATG